MFTINTKEIFPCIYSDGYIDFLRQHQQFPQKLMLNWCKTGKSIQYNHTVFQEYEIPIFMDSRRAVFSNPYIELLRAVLDLAGKDQMLPGIFRILRTGMCGLAAEDVDILENYTLAAGMKSHGRWKKEFDWIPEGFTTEQCEKCEEMRRQIMESLEEPRKLLRSSRTTVREKTTHCISLAVYTMCRHNWNSMHPFLKKRVNWICRRNMNRFISW